MPDLLVARSQMPVSLGFHIVFAMVGITLVLVLRALAAGALVLVPSLVYLFRVFKRQPA